MCDQTTNTTEPDQGRHGQGVRHHQPGAQRSLPDVPTTTEGGLPDVAVGVWHGLYVPKDTPDEIVQALTAALKGALTDPNVIAKFAELGGLPVPEDQATPEAHTAKLQAQIELWRPIIEAAGVTARNDQEPMGGEAASSASHRPWSPRPVRGRPAARSKDILAGLGVRRLRAGLRARGLDVRDRDRHCRWGRATSRSSSAACSSCSGDSSSRRGLLAGEGERDRRRFPGERSG